MHAQELKGADSLHCQAISFLKSTMCSLVFLTLIKVVAVAQFNQISDLPPILWPIVTQYSSNANAVVSKCKEGAVCWLEQFINWSTSSYLGPKLEDSFLKSLHFHLFPFLWNIPTNLQLYSKYLKTCSNNLQCELIPNFDQWWFCILPWNRLC